MCIYIKIFIYIYDTCLYMEKDACWMPMYAMNIYIYICIWIWIWKICIYMYIYRVKEGVNSKGNIIDIYIYVHIYIIPYLIPMGHITIWSLICIAILYDIVLVLQSPVYSWTGLSQAFFSSCQTTCLFWIQIRSVLARHENIRQSVR